MVFGAAKIQSVDKYGDFLSETTRPGFKSYVVFEHFIEPAYSGRWVTFALLGLSY